MRRATARLPAKCPRQRPPAEGPESGHVVRPLKRILQSDLVTTAVCFVASLYIRLVRWTGRWQIRGEEIPESHWKSGKPFIMTFWHGRILMMPYAWRRTDLVNMLASNHRDGRLISKAVSYLGIKTVAGSSSSGGVQATRYLIRAMKDRDGIAGITPDGPRGPRMRVSEGTVVLARLSGAPVIPVTYAASRRRVMGSWDRFILALPFSRGIFIWGDPIMVPRDATAELLEEKRMEIEDALNRLTREADEAMGQQFIEPAQRIER